jgi:ferric-dicitrate binding protein FerR (iron transport regulator)
MVKIPPRAADDLDYERLARYFAGECSVTEEAAIRAWIAADDIRRRRVEQLQRAWEASGSVDLRGDVERGWAALSAKLDDATEGPTPGARPFTILRVLPSSPWTRRPWVAFGRVAVIGVAVALGTFASQHFARRKPNASPPVMMREVTTRRGQQANVYLSDGTRVVLGVASTLRFPTAFGRTRDVELEGEAYFEVAHDTARSFVVRTRYGTARDLGTKFGVRAYSDVAKATVTVTEGSVLLTTATGGADRSSDAARRTTESLSGVVSDRTPGSLVLRAMDVASISADGQLSVTRGAKTGANLAWISGRVVFERMPVGEAVAQINRWYDADVRLGDSTLKRFELTATLTNEPFPRAIRIIAAALDARVERRDSTYTLFRAHR